MLILIASVFMANVNVALGQQKSIFLKITVSAKYMWMVPAPHSNTSEAISDFNLEGFGLDQAGTLDPKLLGVWEQVEYYTSGEFRNITVKSFSITRDGKMNVFDVVSYSTTDNVSIYNRNNPSLVSSFPVYTEGNILYGIDPETREEVMISRYVAGADYIQFTPENGQKTLWRRR